MPAVASQRRQVLSLAIPAFLTLVAEPLFLLADAAIIGHLGTTQLAGLGVAAAILATAASLFVFLAYGTTAIVARRTGAGATGAALSGGIDGLWLAALLGLVVAPGLAIGADGLAGVFGASPEASAHAVVYLRVSAAGLPAMLLVLALTGVLRGLLDTRTPLVAATLGFGCNIVLNVGLVYGLGLGMAGAALGTVIAQNAMAAGLLAVVLRQARAARASLRPHPLRVLAAAMTGFPLFVRTVALRAAILLTTWVAAGLGDVSLATYQVASTVFTFLVFALDALAIAAQALTGQALGAGDVAGARSAAQLMIRWSIGFGLLLGAFTAAASGLLPLLFTPDPRVRAALTASLLVIGAGLAVSAYAFVLDGVLIGAGDGRWLAGAQVVVLIAYAPIILAVHASGDRLTAWGTPVAAAVLWGAYTLFMALRALALGWRARGDAWMVTGLA